MSPKKSYKKIALALSLCALLTWVLLGAGASLAWFSHSAPPVTNEFHFANFDLALSYRQPDGTWAPVENDTGIFDNEALYEPGYVQVVYLRIENKGDREFLYDIGMNVNTADATAANAEGGSFQLQNYLKFGMISANTEAELEQSLPDRSAAKEIAALPLELYQTDGKKLDAGKTAYAALIVRMPEEIDNTANYRGDTQPQVELGVTVTAEQVKN